MKASLANLRSHTPTSFGQSSLISLPTFPSRVTLLEPNYALITIAEAALLSLPHVSYSLHLALASLRGVEVADANFTCSLGIV